MKKNKSSLFIGLALLLLFIAVLFTYQVRTTEVAVVTTFGSYSLTREQPGLYFRFPRPIQEVHRFDNRLRNFERKFEQTTTKDAKNLLISVYTGWRVSDPKIFLERFNGDPVRAEQALENLVRNSKNAVLGSYNFSDLVSPDPKQVKFDEIEAAMLTGVKDAALKTYGLAVEVVGIKQLGLPESITTKVFERMKAERDQLVKRYLGEGEAAAITIRSEADRTRRELLAKAEADALRVVGEADAAASRDYTVFEQQPELAKFLLQIGAFREVLTNRTTLILDADMSPLNLLRGDKAIEGTNK